MNPTSNKPDGKLIGSWADPQEAQTVDLRLSTQGLYQVIVNGTVCAEGLTPISAICAAEFNALRDCRSSLLELLRYIKSEDDHFIYCIDAHQRKAH